MSGVLSTPADGQQAGMVEGWGFFPGQSLQFESLVSSVSARSQKLRTMGIHHCVPIPHHEWGEKNHQIAIWMQPKNGSANPHKQGRRCTQLYLHFTVFKTFTALSDILLVPFMQLKLQKTPNEKRKRKKKPISDTLEEQ